MVCVQNENKTGVSLLQKCFREQFSQSPNVEIIVVRFSVYHELHVLLFSVRLVLLNY